MERLKASGQQALQLLCMEGWRVCNTGPDRLLKRLTVRIVLRVQTLFLDKLPEPLNQLQVGGIGGSVEPLNPQGVRDALHQRTPLSARVVHADSHRDARLGRRSQAQSRTPGLGGHVRQILDRQHLVGDRIQGR